MYTAQMFAKEINKPFRSPTRKSSFHFKPNQLIINSLSLSNKELPAVEINILLRLNEYLS